ncbi:MAG TPA: hypothetical protein VNU93_00630 [Verrucomicrobiae bacterium]|nr:hypothetical protein [Verrucomicrobiae bacterium]
MSSNYYHRNWGIPLLLKIGILVVALYLAWLVLKVFAVVLTALFAVLKVVILVGFILLAFALLLKLIFGIDLIRLSSFRYFRK